MLHGFLGRWSEWKSIIKKLGDDFGFIAIDLPGHGHSVNFTSGIYDFRIVAEAIIDILEQNKYFPCSLLGYSMGGRLALYLAVFYPQYFSHIIVESATPGLQTKHQIIKRKQWEQGIIQKLEELSVSQFIKEWYEAPMFLSLRKHKNFIKLIKQREQNDRRGLINALTNLGTGVMPNLWEKCAQIAMPLFYIVGEKDLKCNRIAKKINKKNPKSTIYTVENCGHNVHFENPDIFCDIVRNIFER